MTDTPASLRPPASFASDNAYGVSPQILAALAACNDGAAASYGADAISARVERRLSELFERDVTMFLVSTGTAANALALSVLTPPWGAVLCHPDSHIENDECGAPEFYTGGAKLMPIEGKNGKIDPAALSHVIPLGKGDVHSVQPACVSLTQASESGTLYAPEEIRAIGDLCRTAGLGLHMDGSRFANAVAALEAPPAELSWKAGVDILSFGATKNGAMGVEAVLLFDDTRASELAFRRKRGGHLSSKMRFLAAQMEAYLEDDLWLTNARQANAMAARLAAGLENVTGAQIQGPVQANIIFVLLPTPMIASLQAQGFRFYSDRFGHGIARLVMSFATTPEDVDRLLAAMREWR